LFLTCFLQLVGESRNRRKEQVRKGGLPPLKNDSTLTFHFFQGYSLERVMSQSLYRYYYYYGPLSDGRDGQAMGCRRALTM
jgi:hypothetical protein